jgi:hypothetical protein
MFRIHKTEQSRYLKDTVTTSTGKKVRVDYNGCSSSSQSQVTWDLWWTKRHWGRFFPIISDSPASHSFHRLLQVIYHPGLVQQYNMWLP